MRQICLIVNPAAGNLLTRHDITGMIERLRAHHWEVEIHRTACRGHATEIARRAARRSYPFVVAVGGDGTIHEVANGLIGTPTALSVVPTGTGNVWASEIQMPNGPDALLSTLHTGEVRSVDVGLANDRYFLTVASIGVDSLTISRTRTWIKRLFGRPSYAATGLRELLRFRPTQAQISTQGQVFECHLQMVVISNTRSYGGVFDIAASATIDDGYLDVVIYTGQGLSTAAKHLLRTTLGRHTSAQDVMSQQVKSIRILALPKLPVHADGEIICFTPVTVTCQPQSLNVLTPPNSRCPLFTKAPIALAVGHIDSGRITPH
jgi:diacylglycerol kinase (ATP)